MSGLEILFKLLEDNNFSTEGLKVHFSKTETDEKSYEEHTFDVIIENQRGIKILGISMFGGKSLLPLVDPPRFQSLDGVKISLAHEAMNNFPLPGIDWVWTWPKWYVLMLDNVDEAGWVYSPYWKPNFNWHRKFTLGDSVRRRLWVRRRHRKMDIPE